MIEMHKWQFFQLNSYNWCPKKLNPISCDLLSDWCCDTSGLCRHLTQNVLMEQLISWSAIYQTLPYLYYFWIYRVHAFIWNDFSPTKTWGSSNSFGYSFWTILPFENPFGCNKIAKKYQTSWHTRSTKPNKPSRLISPPDQPEPSDATDPQDPPEPSSQLWRFSHNFTIVNLLLPKLLPTAHGWEQGAR